MNPAHSFLVLNQKFQLGMTIHPEIGNAYNAFVILRIHGQPSESSYRPSLCSRLY